MCGRALGVLSLSIPLRFLEVGEPIKQRSEIERLIALAFNGSIPANAAVTARCSLPDLLTWQATSGWPAADVIHFRDPVFEAEPAPFPPPPVPDRLQQIALDWFGRLTDTWQTRLVVFEARDLALDLRPPIRGRTYGAWWARGPGCRRGGSQPAP